jgi:hypothetical protein
MTNPNYCGSGGGLCARCDTTNGQQCVGGRCTVLDAGTPDSGFPVCNPSLCPTGCCDFLGGCLDGGAPHPAIPMFLACGTGGMACQLCLLSCDPLVGTCF